MPDPNYPGDDFDEIFGGGDAQHNPSQPPASVPMSRRQAREQFRERADRGGYPERERRRGGWLGPFIVIVVLLGALVGGGVAVWGAVGPKVQSFFAQQETNDYEGSGKGEVTVTVAPGDSGEAIAHTLYEAGVTKSVSAFYHLLLNTKPEPVFHPGSYGLKLEMSARAALSALQDPANRLESRLVVPEGARLVTVLASAAKATGLPLEEFNEAAKDVRSFNVPAQAQSLEGFLFPATYTFEPDVTARQVLETLVAKSNEVFTSLGITQADAYRIVTFASVVQAESGPDPEDMGKIARVFQNRLDINMPLQSDATIHYGLGAHDSIWVSGADFDDAENLYNTYQHSGLPPGPIGNPGKAALQAVLDPTPGDWIFFVTVDLRTGETVFSVTLKEHEQGVKLLRAWCKEAENASYCS